MGLECTGQVKLIDGTILLIDELKFFLITIKLLINLMIECNPSLNVSQCNIGYLPLPLTCSAVDIFLL